MIEESLNKISEIVLKEKQIVRELISLGNYLENSDKSERDFIKSQIEKAGVEFKKTNDELLKNLEEVNLQTPLPKKEVPIPPSKIQKRESSKEINKLEKEAKISKIDKEVLKRLRKRGEEVKKKKEAKPNFYVRLANHFFADKVRLMVKKKKLASIEGDLIKSNLNYTSITYVSILMLTTLVSAVLALILFSFFLFFSVSSEIPMISLATESLGARFLKFVWMIFVIPLGTFLFMYTYPSLEKKSVEGKINQELPFATINMAAISGSKIAPVKIFSIIASTKEYPNIEKEFNKLLNKINIYGYDLVSALRNSAINCPSQKLAELFNGLATTITSGGDMFDFFDKRSQTLLFEYRLDKEKKTKSSETFMDIYISVVIAAPMIFMLLLIMMRISGLGITLSTETITFLIVGGVSLVNIFFLIFLQLKTPENI